ncbi:phage portal protein, partial [Candidatus Falkowbacteria bacterium]
GGSDIKLASPPSVGGFAEFKRSTLQSIAAGAGISYELLGDLSQTNYTSLRAGLIEFRRKIEQIQAQTLIPAFGIVWNWFVEAAALRGILSTSVVPTEWATPNWVAVDPLAQAKADVLELRAGLALWRDKIQSRGFAPDDFLRQSSAFAATLDKLELYFDSDPRKLSTAGQYQPGIVPPGEPTALPEPRSFGSGSDHERTEQDTKH